MIKVISILLLVLAMTSAVQYCVYCRGGRPDPACSVRPYCIDVPIGQCFPVGQACDVNSNRTVSYNTISVLRDRVTINTFAATDSRCQGRYNNATYGCETCYFGSEIECYSSGTFVYPVAIVALVASLLF